jgi:anti-anti-sigma factor
MLTVTIGPMGDAVTLHCAGRIVRGQETAILCAAVSQPARHLVLDLAGVDAIDAAGIGLLVSLQAAGIYLKLVNPTRQVREVLKVTKLETVFEICESQSTVDAPRGDVATVRSEPIGGFVTQSRTGGPTTITGSFDLAS